MSFHETVYTILSGSPDGLTMDEIVPKVRERFPGVWRGRVGAALTRFVLEGWARVDGDLFVAPGPRPVIWAWLSDG